MFLVFPVKERPSKTEGARAPNAVDPPCKHTTSVGNPVEVGTTGGLATTTGPDATHPPAICQNLRGAGGGDRLEGVDQKVAPNIFPLICPSHDAI